MINFKKIIYLEKIFKTFNYRIIWIHLEILITIRFKNNNKILKKMFKTNHYKIKIHKKKRMIYLVTLIIFNKFDSINIFNYSKIYFLLSFNNFNNFINS